MRRFRLAIVVLASALLVVACSGDDDAADTTAPSPSGEQTATEPDTDDTEGDEAGDDFDPGVDPGFAVLTVGDQTWEFNMSGPVTDCGGGLGTHGGLAGFAQVADGELVFNLYPSDHEFEGTQHNAIGVDSVGDGDDWTTAGPSVLADNAGIPGLADAVIETWSASPTAGVATATFYRPSSLDDAKLDLGPLVTETGTFAVSCG